jgi:Leucine-rich repeat (LRR) protein
MERLGQIKRFDVSFNRLERFDVDVEKWGQLLVLKLQFNNITTVHKSVWKHETMVYLHANSNRGLQLPNGEGRIFLPSLDSLNLANNSVLLPGTLGPDELPRVGGIALSGNMLRNGVFPEKFDQLSNTMQRMGIARLGLRHLPQFLPSFNKLDYLDARNNSISNVSKAMSAYFKSQEQSVIGFALYLSGNTGCIGTLPVSACTPLCSEYCQSESYVGDGVYCDPGCNSQDCHFDGGDCEV